MANNEIQEDTPTIPSQYDDNKTYVVARNISSREYHNALARIRPGHAIIIEEQMGRNMANGNPGIIEIDDDADVDSLSAEYKLHEPFCVDEVKAAAAAEEEGGEEEGADKEPAAPKEPAATRTGRRYGK